MVPPQELHEEGSHCFVKKPVSEEGVQEYKMTERTYPEVSGVELAHAFNYGNWRYMKSMSTRSAKGNSVVVWKCMDCGAKLQKTH